MTTLAYAPVEGWEQLPDGVSHPDVADVAVDSRDRVHVFSRTEPPLLVYEPDGTFVRSLGAGIFSDPHGLTIGPDDHLYCADKGDHTVRKLTPDGEVVLTVGTPGHASGTGVGTNPRSVSESAPPFNCPTKVAVLRSGQFYVSDGYGNARVHRFSADGALEASWGEPGDAPGEFDVPHAVAVSPDEQRVYVADRQNDRVQVFDPDGAFLEEWTDVSRPCGLSVDPAGTVFVGELGRRAGVEPMAVLDPDERPWARVSIFAPDGRLLARLGTTDPLAAGSFFAVHGLCLDSRGDLYVAELIWAAGGNRGAISLTCPSLQKLAAA